MRRQGGVCGLPEQNLRERIETLVRFGFGRRRCRLPEQNLRERIETSWRVSGFCGSLVSRSKTSGRGLKPVGGFQGFAGLCLPEQNLRERIETHASTKISKASSSLPEQNLRERIETPFSALFRHFFQVSRSKTSGRGLKPFSQRSDLIP